MTRRTSWILGSGLAALAVAIGLIGVTQGQGSVRDASRLEVEEIDLTSVETPAVRGGAVMTASEVIEMISDFNGSGDEWSVERVVGRPWAEGGMRESIPRKELRPNVVFQNARGDVAEVLLSEADGEVQSVVIGDPFSASGARRTVDDKDATRIADSFIQRLLGDDAKTRDLRLDSIRPLGSYLDVAYWRYVDGVLTNDGMSVLIDGSTGAVAGYTHGWSDEPVPVD